MLRLLLALLSAVAVASPAGRVWLEGPVAVADNRALRLDVQTANILMRARVTRLVVCSAVDQPLVAYDAAAPTTSGCNSPGYKAIQVFPGVENEADSKFHVRQRSRSLYIKRRLLDPASPTVWLQATVEVHNEHGVLVEADHVAMARFQVPERVMAIGQTVPAAPNAEPGLGDQLLKFFHLRESDDALDQLDYDTLDGREDLDSNGTSTRFYHHIHWSIYSAVLFGSLFVLVLVVAAAVCRTRGAGRRPRSSSGGASVYEQVQNERIARWVSAAASQGLYQDSVDRMV
jgi:hypothetical protein